ncbi:MAG: IclR family transcriptional regulator [Gammaproteobacteria bacterium]|nr:MAG: IclR family transcriptional regulator [Gammaproteobacteria bacterium]
MTKNRLRAAKQGAKGPGRNLLIGSVARTLKVMEQLAQVSGPMSIAALAQATGRPKSSLHRVLSTLVHTGFVEQDPETGKYGLTLKMWSLGVSAVADLDIVKIARPRLETLSAAADETVHLAVLEAGGGIIYLAKVESPRSIRVQTQLGARSSSWCTATGRAILAFLPQVREQVLSGALEKATPQTVTDPDRLRERLDQVATQGYAVTKAENHPEMGGIAAPIMDYTDTVVASCGVAIPIFRMHQALIDLCVPLVVRAAADISAELGYRSEAPCDTKHR